MKWGRTGEKRERERREKREKEKENSEKGKMILIPTNSTDSVTTCIYIAHKRTLM